ncbi:hypothetical protein N8Z70_03675 [Candidatus Puniceispirillum sp.]|nr:hypothetical protein [Candidatus Puniceispirillum sp.]
MRHSYVGIHHPLFISPPKSTFRQCVAKKLDINNDAMNSLEELTNRQDKRFQKLGLNGDGIIGKTKFNGRIVSMLEQHGKQ